MFNAYWYSQFEGYGRLLNLIQGTRVKETPTLCLKVKEVHNKEKCNWILIRQKNCGGKYKKPTGLVEG